MVSDARHPDLAPAVFEALEAATAATAVICPRGRICYVNSAFVDLCQLSNRSEAFSRHYHEFTVHPPQAQVLYDHVQRNGSWAGQLLVRRADSSVVAVHVSARRVGEPSAEPSYMITYLSPLRTPPLPAEPPTASTQGRPAASVMLFGTGPVVGEVQAILAGEGYDCEAQAEHRSFLTTLAARPFDLVVLSADGDEAEAIRALNAFQTLAERPQLIVAHRPLSVSLAEAMLAARPDASIRLPDERDKLLAEVHRLLRGAQFGRFVEGVRGVLGEWLNTSSQLAPHEQETPHAALSGSVEWYLDYAQVQMRRIFMNLRNLTVSLSGGEPLSGCQFFACPRLDNMEQALAHSIKVLDKTKQHFKSKELGQLRTYLQSVLDETRQEFQ